MKLRKSTKSAPFETTLPSMDLTPDGPGDDLFSDGSDATVSATELAHATAEVSDHREAVEVLRQMMNAVDQQLSADGTPLPPVANGAAAESTVAASRDRATSTHREPPVARRDPGDQGHPESRADQRGSARARVDGEAPGGLPRRRGPDRRACPRRRVGRAIRSAHRRPATRGTEHRRHRIGEREDRPRALGDPVPLQRPPDRGRRRRPDPAGTRSPRWKE